ncbi:type II toxin-antitoxin system RelE/ParE family toxin [Oceanisphaera litoralis]
MVDHVVEFRDAWPEAFYEVELRVPPGNRFEHLQGSLSGWCSIRVNK